MIPFNEFKREYESIRNEIDEALRRVLDSGWYILGKEGEAFEHEFADYLGARHCVGVANGTEAIALALRSLGIGAGDEVITTDMTAFATVTGIVQAGATPVVIDVRMDDGLMNEKLIEAHITPRTKALIPVHLYGQSCDMQPILDTARAHGLKVVEDCAQAAGSTYRDRKSGRWSDCSAFSFYPTKNLGAYGDGGAVITDDDDTAQRLRSLRNYGQTVRYHHDYEGINSRLDEMQAAILRVKLKHLDAWNDRRRTIAARYREGLTTVKCLKEHTYGQPNYHLFVVRANDRDALAQQLAKEAWGVGTLIHYPVPIRRQRAYNGPGRDAEHTVTDDFAASILSLPMYPTLTDEEVERIIRAVNQA